MNPLILIGIFFLIALLGGVRIVFEYKRAIKFRLGKYVKVLKPGFRWIIPLIDTVQFVDIRIITSNIWSAELSKLVANAFLAQRISSIKTGIAAKIYR